ncbi:helix-turn-helix transcriptional regulator [Sphingomonas panni]|uniref:helix-turn-helix transcriptional regulator n=1 Tax=Sphingomonas panni TaxID=237612 RepID=UPI001F5BD326|nr:helix-turn-helix transcriptional regulator [Sphingomonas panni]
MKRQQDHYGELLELLGPVAMIALAERFGGTRLLIPTTMHADHAIAVTVGLGAARQLSDRMAPDVIHVPLARELRAAHYRAQGQSHAQIALRLGLTEGGVLRLLRRAQRKPAPDEAPQPLPLFPDV